MSLFHKTLLFSFILILTSIQIKPQNLTDSLQSQSTGDSLESVEETSQSEEDSTQFQPDTLQPEEVENPPISPADSQEITPVVDTNQIQSESDITEQETSYDTLQSSENGDSLSSQSKDTLISQSKGETIQKQQPEEDNIQSQQKEDFARVRRKPAKLSYNPKLNPLPTLIKDDTTVVDMWVPAATIGFNISQIALSNWTQGGDNSLTWTVVATNGLKYLGPEWNFRTNFKAAYGRTKLGGEDFRTNDNELFLELVLSKKVDWGLDPYFSNTVRTAITEGFNYKEDPPVEIANFFDPGYVTQGLGFTYDKKSGFKIRLGFAVKETFTRYHREYSDNPETDYEERFKIETGIESAGNYEIEFMENMMFKTSLRLFTRYEHLDVWDVHWDNVIIGRVNKFINVNFTVLVVYEKKQSLKTQLKESLQLGLTFTIL